MYYSSFFFFFFPVINLCSFFYSIFALFIQRFSLFIYSSILVSHFVFFFFFFLVLNSSYSTKRHCSQQILFFFSQSSICIFFPLLYISLYIQCFCTTCIVAATVLWFRESYIYIYIFFFVYSIGIVATMPKVCLFNWHCSYNIFTIIDVSIFYKLK